MKTTLGDPTATCLTCKWRTGSSCRKIKRHVQDDEWCRAYKQETMVDLAHSLCGIEEARNDR